MASGGLQEAGELAASTAAEDAATAASAAQAGPEATTQNIDPRSEIRGAKGYGAEAAPSSNEGAFQARAPEVVSPEGPSNVDPRAEIRGAKGYGTEGLTGKETAAYEAALKNPPPGTTSADFGEWLKANKELANLGGGIIKGAGEMYTSSRPSGNIKAQLERDELNRQRFNDSIRGLNPVNRFKSNWDPNANREVRDVTRFVAKRPGIIRQAGG